MTRGEESFVCEAKNELVALACTMRPTWDPLRLDLALLGAKQAGWPWVRAANAVWRLAMIRDSGPHDLSEEVRASTGYKPPSGSELPEEYRSGRAEIDRKAGDHDDAA